MKHGPNNSRRVLLLLVLLSVAAFVAMEGANFTAGPILYRALSEQGISIYFLAEGFQDRKLFIFVSRAHGKKYCLMAIRESDFGYAEWNVAKTKLFILNNKGQYIYGYDFKKSVAIKELPPIGVEISRTKIFTETVESCGSYAFSWQRRSFIFDTNTYKYEYSNGSGMEIRDGTRIMRFEKQQ